jgi:GTPase KRas protein
MKSRTISDISEITLDSNLIDIKIAILGKSLVGKTALSYRFINDKFPSEHDTTIEDQYTIESEIDGKKCRLEILDTAGQDDYQSMLDTWIISADGFILVYSINDKESFEDIKVRYERIVQIKGKNNFCIIIVGNKCDLENQRKITKDEVEKFCSKSKIKFLETSALNKINVKESFLYVAKSLIKVKLNNNDDKIKRRCFCF